MNERNERSEAVIKLGQPDQPRHSTQPKLTELPETAEQSEQEAKYPGIPAVINGNGAVAHVMNMVCGGVIGYPITPSTEISETFEMALASGRTNAWGKRPFFFEPEGEHSAQSGALGAALTGGKFISNASSSQGILYGMESHFVTAGRKIGGFVLQVAARVVSRASLNVMGGHDDVYSLLPTGYTILFGATPEEAADLAMISYRTSALSLVPVANCMDGFATSHMMSEARLPSEDLVREYLGDPAGYIPSPTVAQDILFGSKGRTFLMREYLASQTENLCPESTAAIKTFLNESSEDIEADSSGELFDQRLAPLLPQSDIARWRRQWINAPAQGTRQLIPALIDLSNPGLTGPVQNQPDFQAAVADHRTHVQADVPALVRRAMREYNELTGRDYAPIRTYNTDDADVIIVALGSISQDVLAVMPYLRSHGIKIGLVQILLLQPFPEAELVQALRGAHTVTVLERSDLASLTSLVNTALIKATQNSRTERYLGIPVLRADEIPTLSCGFFGIGGHDVQPRHLIAAVKAMDSGDIPPEFYIGTTFFDEHPTAERAKLQALLREAYPATEKMQLHLEQNPEGLLPDEAMRIRFHSVGGYGTIATGKLLTDILAEMLHLYSKAAPKYGSEKSGAATNYYITLSPEPINITNAELEDVEIVVCPDHMAFVHTNPLKGLSAGGTLIIQSNLNPRDFWASLPQGAQRKIRELRINLFILDAFAVAKEHAPDESLETRMMGVAFIGAIATKVDLIASGAAESAMLQKIHEQLIKKFGAKGEAVVEANMAVVREGAANTQRVEYEVFDAAAPADTSAAANTASTQLSSETAIQNLGLSAHAARSALLARSNPLPLLNSISSESMCAQGGCAPTITSSISEKLCSRSCVPPTKGLFDRDYFETIMGEPFADGSISESPVYPGMGTFIPAGSAAAKDKGLFRRHIPYFEPSLCTGCMECTLVCPDAAIPNAVFTFETLISTAIAAASESSGSEDISKLTSWISEISEAMRAALHGTKERPAIADVFAQAAAEVGAPEHAFTAVAEILRAYPTARTRPFFDQAEKQRAGKGVLFSVNIDPWKCTGCLECVSVCSPNALVPTQQTPDVLTSTQERFSIFSLLPNSPQEFSDPEGGASLDMKRIFLDRDNYYSTVGGHGACRGCGEVTAIRQTMALANDLNHSRVAKHRAELEDLIARLEDAKAAECTASDIRRAALIDNVLEQLNKRLYRYEGPAGGCTPAGTVVANSTGCSSVYASTAPYNSYQEPWVNGLFQDAQPLAKGIFEGLAADLASDVLAIRQAHALLDDTPWDSIPTTAPEWRKFSEEELSLMPSVLTISGDGAAYDIGFGALSRVLTSGTPLKMLVLNTGAYSNTGGQASTASLEGQDSDLSRFGSFHTGKQEQRKELALLAAMHPQVLVISASTSYQAHFLKNVSAALAQNDYPAVIDVYTSCQPEHGIGDDESAERSRLAVKSRVNPLFVHEPQHEDITDRFILAGNPNVNDTWSKNRLSYIDDEGAKKILNVEYTPADFAYGERRFRKHFQVLADDAPTPTPVAEFLELTLDERSTATPFIYTVDKDGALKRIHISADMVALTQRCRDYWHMLQFLAGHDLAALRKENMELLKKLNETCGENK